MSEEKTEEIEYWENGMAKKEYHHKNEKLEELATKIQELLFKF